jgi:uncharacterized MAPEG superfamily protein
MTIEMEMLALSIVLGLVHIILNASTATKAYGLDWNTSARDTPMPPLVGVGGRLQRALHNFIETFAFFAAAVLAADALNRHNALTHIGVQLYFWGRVAYLPLYAYGVPKARSAAWGVATLGIVLILIALI